MLERIFGLPGFGLSVALGTFVTYLVAARLAKREGYPKDTAVDVMLICIVGGVIGCRILHIIQYWSYFAARPWVEMLRVDKGGLSWYGCFFTILPSAYVYCRKKGFHPLAIIDLFTITVPMGQLFGRVGCFLNGCCFGAEAPPGSLFGDVAIRFPTWSPAWGQHAQHALGRALTDQEMAARPVLPAGLPEALTHGSWPVVPVQPLMSAMGLLATAFFLAYYGRHRKHGQAFAATFGLLGLTRFLFEMVRADESPGFLGLTESQWTSLGALAFAGLLFALATRFGADYRGPLAPRPAA